MTERSGFVDFILDQLAEVHGVSARAMFGGFGLYLRDTFFGVVYDDRLYLKTDVTTRRWYEERGMSCFQPSERQSLKNYFEVPAETIERREQLGARAIEAALTLGHPGPGVRRQPSGNGRASPPGRGKSR